MQPSEQDNEGRSPVGQNMVGFVIIGAFFMWTDNAWAVIGRSQDRIDGNNHGPYVAWTAYHREDRWGFYHGAYGDLRTAIEGFNTKVSLHEAAKKYTPRV